MDSSSKDSNRQHLELKPVEMWKTGVPCCVRCGNAIYDKTLLCILDRMWHHSCLQCSMCNKPLDGTCYSDGRNLLCYEDYMKVNQIQCSGCKMVLSSDDMVQRVHRNIYHQTCFRCVCCDQPIQTGGKFYLRDDDKLVCDNDYDSIRTKDFEEDDSDSECSTGSGKRFRTTITQQQLQRLLVEYNKAPKPSRETRKRLSRELRLDYRVIQVWFQNRRAKSKKRSPRDERHSRTQQNDVDLHQRDHDEEHNVVFHDNLYKTPPRRNNITDWLTTVLAPDSVPPNMEFSPVDIRNGEVLQRSRLITDNRNVNSVIRTSCKFQMQT